MQAPETPDPVGTTDSRARGACLIAGCVCKDPRIISYRRAAFFAAIARARGQTARRALPVEPEWRIGAA